MKIIGMITLAELRSMAERMYGTIVKADVDVAKKIVAIDMDMHADGEAYLLERGSQQADLWGINLHPDKFGADEFIEFDSMMNIPTTKQSVAQCARSSGAAANYRYHRRSRP